jgi:Zn-dependent protease with chaperone function
VEQQRNLSARAVASLKQFSGRISLHSLAMYTLALISEMPVILLRCTFVFVLASIVLAASGHSLAQGAAWIEIGLIPTLWSMLALATPLGTGWWWKQRSGARKPSQREQLAYQDAIELLQAQTRAPLKLPKSWYVLDTPTPDAAVCGETLMLSRGLLESNHLPAALAHELGHLATTDGRLTAAINRLVLLPPRHEQTDHWHAIKLFTFLNGGFGLWLSGPLWGAYWRKREYKADAYAAKLGQAEELAGFLENHALIHDHPVPYIWLTEHTHPPVELRIDKLRDA